MKEVLILIILTLIPILLIIQLINAFKDFRNLELAHKKLLKELEQISNEIERKEDRNGN